MTVSNGAIKHDAERVRGDARTLGEDLGRIVDHARDAFPEYAQKARDLFDEGVERLRGQSADAKDAAGEGLENARLYVVERVQERPLTVTLAALGVGVLVGLLFASGSRR